MNARLLCLAAALAACSEPASAPSLSQPLLPPTILLYEQPDIRFDGYDGSNDVSGTKLMEPETLGNILEGLLGAKMTMDIGDGAYAFDMKRDEYPRGWTLATYVGGVDYEPITSRSKGVSPVMPLVMKHTAEAFCEQAASTDLNDGVADTAAIERLHIRLRSRPPTTAVVDAAVRIRDTSTDAAKQWLAVCAYFFLRDGSFLLY